MSSWPPVITRCLLGLSTLTTTLAHAGENELLLSRTKLDESPAPHSELAPHARTLDQILAEAAPDLGLEAKPLPESAAKNEADLPQAAANAWVVVPHLGLDEGKLMLRLVAVAPGTEVLLVRVQTFAENQLELRALVMLQELFEAGRRSSLPTAESQGGAAQQQEDAAPASAGRAVLALNAAIYGGYVGYTAHRASGSDDARLLYPLTALGAGLGLGASMLIADEWNVTQGVAWYLSAGQVWPGLAGFALGAYYDERSDYHHLYGLLGATSGLVLATTTVSLVPTTPGQAALTHSGGAFGTLIGGLVEALARPELDEAPLRGMGYGSALGVLTLGALAPSLKMSASRVLFVDLSAGLGALTGAALASPVLFVGDDVTEQRSRVWFASVIGGTLLGAGVGTWMTRGEADAEDASSAPGARPYVGVIGFDRSRSDSPKPIFGGTLDGEW